MSNENTMTLEDAIALIVSQATIQGVRLTKTKLVKLLYFLDLRAWEEIGRTVTGAEWLWYHYGPYAPAIDTALHSMECNAELTVETVETYYGNPEHRYQTLRAQYYRRPTADLERLVRGVVRELGHYSPTQIKDLSYQTAPMLKVIETGQKGDVLEFEAPRPRAEDVQRTLARYARLLPHPDDAEAHDEYGDVAAGLREDADALTPARVVAMERMLADE